MSIDEQFVGTVDQAPGPDRDTLDDRQAQAPRRRRRRVVLGVLAIGLGAPLVWGTVDAIVAGIESSRSARCRERLKHVGLAMHDYLATHESFPAAAIAGRDGRPLLSWRVAILPQLGHRALHDQFRRDEPWDSPHNLALLSKMPEVFACPSEPGRIDGLTNYQVLVGPQTMFEGREGTTIEQVTDGTSNTFLIVEARRPVPWTKPEDLAYVPDDVNSRVEKPLPAFGSRHKGGFHALMADGAVKFLKWTITSITLRSLITRDGGEVLSND